MTGTFTPTLVGDPSRDPLDPGGLADASPETAWNAFQVAALALLHDLREVGREELAGRSIIPGRDPGAAVVALLDDLRVLGERLPFPQDLVGVTVNGVASAFCRHAEPGCEPSWRGVVAGCQEAGDEISEIVSGIADEMDEILADLVREGAPDPVSDRTVEAMINVITYMRMVVAAVSHAGKTPRA